MRQSSGLEELGRLDRRAGRDCHMRLSSHHLGVVVLAEEESEAEGRSRRAGELGGGGEESLAAGRRSLGAA